MLCQKIKHADILRGISKVQTSIPISLELNHLCGHQDKRIPAKLLDRPSQINIECDVLGKRLVREQQKQNVSTREALPHEGMICEVTGRKVTGNIVKSVCDKRSRITMGGFLPQKGRMKRTTFDLVDWGAVDKMMRNFPQHFCLWVTNHVSTFYGTNKILHRWGFSTDALCH